MELYDFSKANVDDTVTCMLRGKGVIVNTEFFLKDYPIKVKFSNEIYEYYTKNGFMHTSHNTPTLYPGDVEFTITITEKCPYEVGEEIRVRDSQAFNWAIVKFKKFSKDTIFPIEDERGIMWKYHDKLVISK